MEKGFAKRILAGSLAVMIIFGCLLGERSILVQAATFNDINRSEVFLKQPSGSNTCTLVAATMLVRRGAMLNGNANWSGITTDVMQTAAWITGTGLKWDFNCGGITVTHGNFSGDAGDLAVLLAEHPEGIVLYKKKSDQNHAVLVTDYTDGVFYCADPSPGAQEGRIPMSSATISIEDSNYIWYVTSPDLYLTDTAGNIISHEKVDSNSVPKATATPKATAKPMATVKPTATPKATATSKVAAPSKSVTAPKRVSSLAVKNNKKKTLTTSWGKVSGAKGYQVIYSTQKSFEEKNTLSQTEKKCHLTKLTKGEVYYVKVRAYKLSGSKKVYGKCSTVKKAKVKK